MRFETTAHFEIGVPVGSFSDERSVEVGARLEALVGALAGVLDLSPDALAPSRIRIVIGDVISGKAEQAQATESLVFPERREIHCIYRPDAPGVNLERSTVRLLVLAATGVDPVALPLLWAGLSGLSAQQSGQAPVADELNHSLLEQVGPRAPALSDLWDSAGKVAERDLSLIALSFVGFLQALRGGVALRQFITVSAAGTLDNAARTVYRRPLSRLQGDWWKAVHKSGSPPAGGILRFLRACVFYLRPYWKQELAIAAFLLVQLAFQQILPRAQALLIDKAILPRDLHYLLGLALFLFSMVVFVLLAGVLRDLLNIQVSESVLRSLRERMFSRLQQASHRFYSRMDSGDILSRFTNDLRSVQDGLSNTLTQGVMLLLTLVLSAVHILLVNWILGVIVLVCLPLFLLAARVLGPRVNSASLTFAQEQAAVTGAVQEDIGAQPVIKAYSLEATMQERFAAQARELYHSTVRLYFFSSILGLTANLLTTLLQVMVLALGGYFVIEGRLLLGSLMEFLALMGLVIGPAQSIGGLLQSIQVATASMDRLNELLNLEPDVRDTPGAVELGPLHEGIRFENVSFSYEGGQSQLENISFEIPAGSSVAFVGPSGSGKSTIINLLMRFYDPDRGRILIDGHDLREVTLQSLRQQVASVFQENFLFNTSVRENIRCGRLDATDQEIEEAATRAAMHEIILQMPSGYNTQVGERGGSLSGGQRQRLAVARAVLRQPSILVLDEATSALDAQTENSVNQTLAAVGRGRTVVTVTHRLSAVAAADRIFVLDHGRLVEQGTQQELLEVDGLYRRLYEELRGASYGDQRALEISYLRGVPLFADLDTESLDHVAALLHAERVPAGDDVVKVGAAGERLYLIVEGALDVLAPSATGGGRLLATLGPGDYFGEIALLRDVPRTATVRARMGSHLLALDREALRGLLEAFPSLRDKLEVTISAREAVLTESVATGTRYV